MAMRMKIEAEALPLVLRYGAVGLATYLVYIALLGLGVAAFDETFAVTLCGAGAFITASGFNYVCHHAFTFRSQRSHAAAAPRFGIVLALGALLAAITTAIFSQFADGIVLIGLQTLYLMAWTLLSVRLLNGIFRPATPRSTDPGR